MSALSKVAAAAALIAIASTAALAAGLGGSISPQIGGGVDFGTDGGISGKSAPAAPAASGKILLVDGASFILQTDGTSKICRAGGC